MRQFSAYRNANSSSNGLFPLFVNIQSDLVDALSTRLIVPLAEISAYRGKRVAILMPELSVDGKQYLMVTHQMMAVRLKELGVEVEHLATQRATIMKALDFLISGI